MGEEAFLSLRARPFAIRIQKSSCYIPIVRSATLWERSVSHANPHPHHERTALPCSRFIAHMKNFSESLKFSSLRFLRYPVFPEAIQTPMARKKLLYTCQYSVPSSPDVSIASFEEESHEEASSRTTSSSEWYETPLMFTVRQEFNKSDRGAPKQAWSSVVLEKPMTEVPVPSNSAYPLRLEAAGTQLIRHVRCQNQPSRNSKRNSVPPGPTARPSTAIGLCGRRQSPLAPSRVSWSSSETKLEERMAATGDTLANPDSQSRLQGAPGNLVRRDAVAMTPEMLPKHLHPLEIKGPRADASLHDSLAGAPHLQLAGSPTHLPTKKLIVTCSYPPSRPPPRFHTVCSQAPPRLRVNAHLY
ncbi:uncharacterized protein C12orf42 homolog [Rousettus aegyptiacus]|uniref:Uncharacterized protein n=1 Tax=Rousettus aegyptiacus TaxID=9407 RepID=A0A7J8JAH1_ROUAE|nr:uncharacterized protein C12orf42 homolog [Rousettus aegyptiacus]KAF6493847.1 hypothetical protein HJG63_001673 [Rousettus aegyptiacus]